MITTTRTHAQSADLYTQAAHMLSHTLAEHRIRYDADTFADLMETFWDMLQQGPVILDCKAGVIEFQNEPKAKGLA